MLRFFSIFLASLLFSISAIAQSAIIGKVYDDDGNALVGVIVQISSLGKGAITNIDGSYKIENLPNKTLTVKATSLGYKPQTKTIELRKHNSHTLNFRLSAQSVQHGEVVVTAKSEARRIREQAMPISVITMDELQGTVSNVNDVIAKTAGVTIRASGGVGSSSRISVRGLEGKRVGFYIDGRPMSDNADYININDIPVDLIERIEIYKGIVPPKFGGSALGGAVNIVIKEYPTKYMDASYYLQSFNTHKITGVFKRNHNKIEAGIGGFYTYSDNSYKMQVPKITQEVTRSHDRFRQFVLGGGVRSYKWYFDEMSIEPSVSFMSKQIQGIEIFDVRSAETSTGAFQIGFYAEKTNFLVEGLDLDLANTYTYTRYALTDTSRYRHGWDGDVTIAVNDDGIGLGEIGLYPNTKDNKRHALYQGTNLNFIIDDKNSLNINSQFQYAFELPSDTLKERVIGYKIDFNSTLINWTTGLTYEYNSENRKLTNAASIKYYYYSVQTKLIDYYDFTRIPEKIDNVKNDYGISNAIRFRFTSEFLMKSSIAYDVRMPSSDELLGDVFFVVPAGNLSPERNTSFNIGFMYDKTNLRHNRLQIELNLFYQHLENMIRFTGGSIQSMYQNFGEMRSLGGEFEIKWDATTWLYVWGNVTYQDLRDIREYESGTKKKNPTYEYRMPNIPYFFANSGIEFHKENLFGGTEQNTRLFGDCSFVEEYFYDFEQSIYQERRIPRSLTFNAGLEHSFKNQSIFLSLQVNNITNASIMSEFNRPLPRRNFGVKVRYVFK